MASFRSNLQPPEATGKWLAGGLTRKPSVEVTGEDVRVEAPDVREGKTEVMELLLGAGEKRSLTKSRAATPKGLH